MAVIIRSHGHGKREIEPASGGDEGIAIVQTSLGGIGEPNPILDVRVGRIGGEVASKVRVYERDRPIDIDGRATQ